MLPRLLLDTDILIRWLSDDKKLSREQLQALKLALKRTEPIAISAITLIEIALLVSGGRLKVQLKDFLGSIQANPIFRIMPITFEIAAEVAFVRSLADPADRTIVATALANRLTLVTSDQRIVESGIVKTIG